MNPKAKSKDETLIALVSLQQELIQHLQAELNKANQDAEYLGNKLDEYVEDLHELIRFIVDRKLICIACDVFTDNKRMSDRLDPYYEEYLEDQKLKELNSKD